MRRTTRRLGNAFSGVNLRLPPPETLGGWALALLLISWLLTLPIVSGVLLARILQPWALMLGVLLLTVALVSSLMRGRSGGFGGGKMWRGERISYGSPYGESWLNRLRRFFRGR
jgi:hypothetical protein